jgi:hypothetical protein
LKTLKTLNDLEFETWTLKDLEFEKMTLNDLEKYFLVSVLIFLDK